MADTRETAPALGADGAMHEPRETGGVTTRLILAYTEREGGKEAVRRLLRRCGLEEREELLRDENHWSSFDTKIDMLEAAAEVLGDPLVAQHIGESGLDFNVGQAIKLSLRALGSPRFVYKNIIRACAKFSLTHRMNAVDIGRDHARIEYIDVAGKGFHPLDCQLNVGYLSSVPEIFGLPQARVRHPVCARDGGDRCVYDVRWSLEGSGTRRAAGSLVGAGALLTGVELFAPGLLFAATGLVAGLGAVGTHYEVRRRRRRWRLLEAKAEQQAEVADRLSTSLQDLVSDLRAEEVLGKITRNAQSAVGGKEFALLVEDEGGIRCESSSGLPPSSIAALESWATESLNVLDRLVTVDDVRLLPVLAPLASHPELPLFGICAAPLLFHGRSLGVLVALANGVDAFLPREHELLQSYAAQAAIALTNARLFEAQETLASRDPLTGLLNHREFHETVARELARCRRHGGELSVVLFDLDGFKLVNDSSGHSEGDRILRLAADALASACREADAAFRVGGDEFALVLPNTSPRDAEAVCERARQSISAVDTRVSASFGIASWPDEGPSKDTMLQEADARLYAMKRSSGESRALATGAAAARPQRPADQHERLASASRLSAKLAPLLDPSEIANATVDELVSSFGYLLVMFQRLDDDQRLRPVAAGGRGFDELPSFLEWEQGIDQGMNGRVARTGEPAIVANTSLDPDYIRDRPIDAGSALAVPIRVAGVIWGVLDLERIEEDAFDTDDLMFADMVAAQVGAALHRAHLFGELENTFVTTLAVLCDALESKDTYTAAHARDVADLTEAVAERLGLAADEVRTIRYAALLHDIGKIGIPSEILNKPGALTDEEFEVMKEHTVIGARMLERIPFFEGVHPLVLSAHERWDGAGYPDGLAGDDIPLGARIICACDAYHAMTSDRPYRPAMPVETALAELRRNAGTQFDPVVTGALIAEIEAGDAQAAAA